MTTPKAAGEKLYSFPVGFSLQEEELRFRLRSWRVGAGAEPQ